MLPAETNRWAKFSFSLREAAVYIDYSDGSNNSSEDGSYDVQSLNYFVLPVYFSANIKAWLLALTEPSSTADNIRSGVLPIFIEGYEEIDDIVFPFPGSEPDNIIRSITKDFLGDYPVEMIYYLPETPIKPFALPLNIHYTGYDDGSFKNLFNDQAWYMENQVVREYGIKLHTNHKYTGEEETDILIIEDVRFYDFFRLKNNSIKPLLIIIIDVFPEFHYSEFVPYITGTGCACIHLNGSSFAAQLAFTREFLLAIFNDQPLHEALNNTNSMIYTGGIKTVLYASPASNHALRLARASDHLNKVVEEFNNISNPGDMNYFLEKLNNTPHQLNDLISSTLSKNSNLKDFFAMDSESTDFPGNVQSTFEKISSGTKNFQHQKNKYRPIGFAIQELVDQPGAVEVLKNTQERRADITLEELLPRGLYRRLDKSSALTRDGHYRLNVRIGQSSANNLITGEIPPIDPLLPDPPDARGNEIEIVVFAKDFTLISAVRKIIYLPVLGGTLPASFDLVAPAAEGLAELRICIYHQNNLLQGFLLKAMVGYAEVDKDEPQLSVTLDLSTSFCFTNLENINSPDLYIGVNKNSVETHSLFIKKDDYTQEIGQMPEAIFDDAVSGYRKLLLKAYFDSADNPKFNPAQGAVSSLSAPFQKEINLFARFGYNLYKTITKKGGEELSTLLREIKSSGNNKIQIGCHDPNLVFPWPILYDYDAPPDITGIIYPVCTGNSFAPGEHDAFKNKPGCGCPHNPSTATWCMDGFWGIRNRIEQIFTSAVARDSQQEISDEKKGIVYSCNVKDNFTTGLLQRFNAFTPYPVIVTPASELMEVLWENTTRPSSLVVFGHLDKDPVNDEPAGARIITFPKEDWEGAKPIPDTKWIYCDLIFKYRGSKDRWKNAPLPIVFLINCSSGQLGIASQHTIVEEFYLSGAAAIIATECDITTGLGARFIEEVLNGIYNKGQELGEAIRDFNRNLFLSGIPLGFVFTCYGNSNLKINKTT